MVSFFAIFNPGIYTPYTLILSVSCPLHYIIKHKLMAVPAAKPTYHTYP